MPTYKLARLSSGFFMSGVRESGFGYKGGVEQHKEETQLHNQEIRLSPGSRTVGSRAER